MPAPGRAGLPAPVSLRRMVGPSIILAGLSIGSGEFVLWPRLTAEYGFAVFWGCWIGVSIQFILNTEFERWTLATGESAVAGIAILLLVLALLIVRWETALALLAGAARVGEIPDGIELPLLLGALAFAGAGGSVNLAQSNYINDKGYGMGRWIGRITSPFTVPANGENVLPLRHRSRGGRFRRRWG